MSTYLSVHVILIAVLYYFYFNHRPGLTREEIDAVCVNEANSNPASKDFVVFHICDALKAADDDGDEFYMLNLIKRPTDDDLQAAQSVGIEAECKESTAALMDCYGKRIMPLLFKRFAFPLVQMKPSSSDPLGISTSLIRRGFVEQFEFDFIVVVRYRSKRDFLEMVQEIKTTDIEVYKQLSVHWTAVYLTESVTPITKWIVFVALAAVISLVCTLCRALVLCIAGRC